VKIIKLNNDVFTMADTDSTSFGAVVNKCSTAVKIDKEFGLNTYTQADCQSKSEENLSSITVYWKVMSLSSDPAYFEKHGEM